MKEKTKWILANWKSGVHIVLHTKRFGVNNQRWCRWDSIHGWSTRKIVWAIIRVKPIIQEYKRMKIRAIELGFLPPKTIKLLGWADEEYKKNYKDFLD